jgi:hypothetical protein
MDTQPPRSPVEEPVAEPVVGAIERKARADGTVERWRLEAVEKMSDVTLRRERIEQLRAFINAAPDDAVIKREAEEEIARRLKMHTSMAEEELARLISEEG